MSSEYKWNAELLSWIWTDNSMDDGGGRFVRDTGSGSYSDGNDDEDDVGSGMHLSNTNNRNRVKD